ncbi:DUF2934 domain-containing protein [Roseomonas sp. 18066]|uniref:DUF2934 domain-containing protein n=1 Tax=Roseomonas sp. 18066 TaxID=2681412 RepID=UPI00135891F3|nr:DUF2934 domain-containing protein [Roseomonas sp. 18066]
MAKPAKTPKPPSDAAIRDRAHALWEKSGHAHGDDHDHWHRARAELEAESAELDEQLDDSFPASDPPSLTDPSKGPKLDTAPKKKPAAPKAAKPAAEKKPPAEKKPAKDKAEKKPAPKKKA